jgi:hypothetical protein
VHWTPEGRQAFWYCLLHSSIHSTRGSIVDVCMHRSCFRGGKCLSFCWSLPVQFFRHLLLFLLILQPHHLLLASCRLDLLHVHPTQLIPIILSYQCSWSTTHVFKLASGKPPTINTMHICMQSCRHASVALPLAKLLSPLIRSLEE